MTNREYLSYQNYLRGSLGSLKSKIDNIKENNKNLEANKVRQSKLDEIGRNYMTYRNSLGILFQCMQKLSDKKQEDRIAFLNEYITNRLASLFPEHGYAARLNYDKGRADTVRLELIKPDGTVSTPNIGQGQLMQYIISYSAVESIAQGLGVKNIFIDEAFGVCAENKLPEIGDMINASVNEGCQIILVSQHSELYDNIPHREIRLEMGEDCVTKVSEVKDF